MAPGSAVQLAGDLWLLDTHFQGEPGVVGSYLIAGEHGLALIDVGPGSTLERVLAGVRAAGFDPADVTHVILTHVHLDHAGAAGELVQRLPQARVYAHPIGVPHLLDPSKLVASARRIYGERMGPLWGEMVPVHSESLEALDDGAQVRVGNRMLRAVYTPGHAVHHIALHDAANGDLFTGDVAGVRLPGVAFVRPPTPPPDLNLEEWYASLERIESLHPTRLYLGHFGPTEDVGDHLAQLRHRLALWGQITLAGLRAGASDALIAAQIAERSRDELAQAAPIGVEEETVHRYEVAANYLMSAQGYMRYWRKRHPEALA